MTEINSYPLDLPSFPTSTQHPPYPCMCITSSTSGVTMAHSRESRQAAKRLTACSSLRHVTTATRPSITPHSDGLTHAFCQGAEPQRWSLFNLHADTLPFPLSLLALSQVHKLTNTGDSACAQTHTRMPAATIRHKHIYMYATVLRKTRVCHFLQMTLPTHYTSQ